LLRPDDYNKSQLVLASWRHGKVFGGHLGSCLIMSVLANRQKVGWGSWGEVIHNIPKYSATIEQPTDVPLIWAPDFTRLLHEVEAIYAGSMDYSKGGMYWLDSSQAVTNPWFKERILSNLDIHAKVADMNSLMNFK
jgi:hypothetical protein